MNTLKDAIRSAGIDRGIIEAGAPVDESELIAIVKCLGMGPKMHDKSKEISDSALDAAIEKYHATQNGYQWFQNGNNFREAMKAAIQAALRPCEGESAEPVAVFEGYVDGMPVIRWEGDKLPVGTEFYASPSAERSQDAGVTELKPKWEGEFKSYEQWVNKGQSWLKSPSHRPAICIDTKGRRCAIGADMMRARDEGAFPVRYFWEFEVGGAQTTEGAV